MSSKTGIAEKLLGALRRAAPEDAEDFREGWPFLAIVTLVMSGLYLFALYLSPELRSSPTVFLFSALMALYTALFWIMHLFPTEERWAVTFLVLQTLLATLLIVFTRIPFMIFGLYAPVMGLSVAVLRERRKAAAAILILLGLTVIGFVWVEGPGSLVTSAIFILPMAIFVIVYVELYVRQAEARERAQSLLEELEIAHSQLAEYAAQVEDLTRSAERQRMARELHDTLAQGLAGLILQLEASNSHLDKDRPARAQEIIQQAMGRARETLAEARQAIGDLREESGAGADLSYAIAMEVERFSTACGIPCHLEVSLDKIPSQEISEHAFRVVAEGLANAAQHAQATQVWVRAVSRLDRLEIEVRDNGIGFDARTAQARGHFGLIGMRERARLAGGLLTVDSAPGQGTVLRLRLPLEAA